MAKFTITGIEEINQALKQLPKNVQKKAFRKAMRPAMKVVQNAAKANAPVSGQGEESDEEKPDDDKPKTPRKKRGGTTKNHKPGTLKRSIKVRATKRSRRFIGIDVLMGEGDFKGEVYYGAFQEYGSRYHRPQGFLRKAHDTKEGEARAKAIEILKQLVDEETRKLASK